MLPPARPRCGRWAIAFGLSDRVSQHRQKAASIRPRRLCSYPSPRFQTVTNASAPSWGFAQGRISMFSKRSTPVFQFFPRLMYRLDSSVLSLVMQQRVPPPHYATPCVFRTFLLAAACM